VNNPGFVEPGHAERRAVLIANQGLLRHRLEEQNRLGLQEQNRLQAAVHAAHAVVLAANIARQEGELAREGVALAANIARQEADLAIAFDAGEANIRVARLAQDVRNAHAALAARIAELAALGPVAIGPHEVVAQPTLAVLQQGGGVGGGPLPLVHVQEAAAFIPPYPPPPPSPPPPAPVYLLVAAAPPPGAKLPTMRRLFVKEDEYLQNPG